MVVKYVPARGNIVWLNFDPQNGKEIKKTRPALTISPQNYNAKTGLALFMPITSQIKGYPFEVRINCSKINGAILCDQIRFLDWKARNAVFIDNIDENSMTIVKDKLNTLIE